MIKFKLSTEVTLEDINNFEKYLKSEGKLKSTRYSYPSGYTKITFDVPNGESYVFQSNENTVLNNQSKFKVLKFPGYTSDEDYKGLSMASVVGIPSDKKTKKYYDRRKV